MRALQALEHLVAIRQLLQDRTADLPLFEELRPLLVTEMQSLLDYLRHTVALESSELDGMVPPSDQTVVVKAGVSKAVSAQLVSLVLVRPPGRR